MSVINVKIDTEREQKKTEDVIHLYATTEAMVVVDQLGYESAATILKEVKSRYKEIDEQRKAITKPLDEAKKNVMDLFNKPLELLKKAEDFIKGRMIAYTNEQERKAKEEQKRLQDLADKEAERQKKLLDAKIERAEASGKEDKVEELKLQKELVTPIMAPIIAPVIETPKGVSYKELWSAEVTDIKLLPDEYKLPNIQALNKVAQATKGTISIPGVIFKSEKILSSRGQ